MQSSRQIRQHRSRFVVRVRRDVENARRYACALDGLDRLCKARPGPRRGRELSVDRHGGYPDGDTANEEEQPAVTLHNLAPKALESKGHSFRIRARTRKRM